MLASSHMRAVRACVRVVHMHVYRGWGLNSVCTEVGVFGVRAGMCSMCVCVCFAFVCGETDRDCHEVFRSVGRVEHTPQEKHALEFWSMYLMGFIVC